MLHDSQLSLLHICKLKCSLVLLCFCAKRFIVASCGHCMDRKWLIKRCIDVIRSHMPLTCVSTPQLPPGVQSWAVTVTVTSLCFSLSRGFTSLMTPIWCESGSTAKWSENSLGSAKCYQSYSELNYENIVECSSLRLSLSLSHLHTNPWQLTKLIAGPCVSVGVTCMDAANHSIILVLLHFKHW